MRVRREGGKEDKEGRKERGEERRKESDVLDG